MQNRFQSFDQQLTSEYTSFGNQVIENSQESPKNVSEKLQGIGDGAGTIAKMANEHAEAINHGLFQMGHLIKALLKHIPNIIKESIVESISGGEDKHLLSVQKLYNIASNEKFGEFVGAMSGVVSKHGKLLEGLSGEDNSGIIQIFKELQNNEKEIEKFLTKAKDNASKLDTDTNSYQCATKLMMHVFIGKKEMEDIKTNIDNLTKMLETLKTSINSVLQNTEHSQISVETLTSKLEDIKNKADTITDPCPK